MIVCRLFTNTIAAMSQRTLIVDLVFLLHENAKVVRFTLFGLFSALQVLLRDVRPVTQATFHDSLNQSDLLQSTPVASQQRKVQVVVYVVVMCR